LTDSGGEVVADAPAHDGVSVTPTFVTGIDTSALDIVDANDVVTITDSNDIFNFYPQGYTFSAWVNMTPKSDFAMIVCKIEEDPFLGPALRHDNTGDARHYLWPLPSTDGSDVDDEQWYLVTGIYDPSLESDQVKLYVNGVLEDSSTGSSTPDINSGALIFGNAPGGSYQYTGLLDDVRIWSYPLDDYEVAHLYTDIETDAEICVENPEFDISGPDGNPDCQVDLYDLGALAGAWLNCNIVPTCQ
jgi:hypothetical protein